MAPKGKQKIEIEKTQERPLTFVQSSSYRGLAQTFFRTALSLVMSLVRIIHHGRMVIEEMFGGQH